MTGVKLRLNGSIVPAIVLAAGLALVGFTPSDSVFAKDAAVQQAPLEGTPKRLRLLTTQQYINTIQHLFGPDIKVDVKFAPLPRTDGLLVAGSSVAGVSGAQIESYQKIAGIVAAQVMSPERRNTLVSCKPKSETAADDACAAKFLGEVTAYLYRSPLSKERLAKFVFQAGKTANDLQDFYAGLQVALEGAMLSGNAMFVAEGDEPDPKHPGQRRLDAYSLASRLSLFLWDAAPDAALREAARRGDLYTERGRAKVVDMMLASPRLEAGVRAFFDDMLGFDSFANLTKDGATYPYFIGEAPADAREQTLRTVIDHLVANDGDYRDLYVTRQTFVSPSLGVIYGVDAPPGWTPIEFPPEAHRSGILTHVSFLALHSHPGRSSATLRGKALRELLLCQAVPMPPANVDFSALENPKTTLKTARDRVNFHLENPVCAGCHKITDPMGLALENFDGAGRYRNEERGSAIDASGSLDGKAFTDVDGLGQAMRDHPALPKCLVRRAFGYATAGSVARTLDPTLAGLNDTFASKGYRLRALYRAIALNEAFYAVAPPAPRPDKAASLPPLNNVTANPN